MRTIRRAELLDACTGLIVARVALQRVSPSARMSIGRRRSIIVVGRRPFTRQLSTQLSEAAWRCSSSSICTLSIRIAAYSSNSAGAQHHPQRRRGWRPRTGPSARHDTSGQVARRLGAPHARPRTASGAGPSQTPLVPAEHDSATAPALATSGCPRAGACRCLRSRAGAEIRRRVAFGAKLARLAPTPRLDRQRQAATASVHRGEGSVLRCAPSSGSCCFLASFWRRAVGSRPHPTNGHPTPARCAWTCAPASTAPGRVGGWVPLDVQLVNEGAELKAQVEVVVDQPGGRSTYSFVPTTFSLPVVLPRLSNRQLHDGSEPAERHQQPTHRAPGARARAAS